MILERLHHRLVVAMALAALAAAWGGGVLAAPVALAGAAALALTLLWRPRRPRGWLERAFTVGALLLAVRAAYVIAVRPDDRLLAMVDLLLFLLVSETWKAPERADDIRLYVLTFALLLAATVFRPGLIFALAFVVYVMVSTVALMVGHLRRQALRYEVGEVAVGRRFLLRTGALSLVTLGISVAVFLAFPRVSRGWAQGGPSIATQIAGFADQVSLDAHGATIEGNPDVVLRVEFPDGRPESVASLRWRGRSYDRFDGVRWSQSSGAGRNAPGTGWYRRRWEGRRVRQDIYAALLDSRVLFALHPVVDVDARNRIRPVRDAAGDLRFYGSLPPHYTAWSVLEAPSPEALRRDRVERPPPGPHYLQLPPLSPRVAALGDSLVAGRETRYDSARAIEGWLRGLDYTRELPATAAETGLEHFLFERQAGHCEYFSTAMVVLLRAQGIPARNVNGFLGGQWNTVGDHLAVTQNEAHSWVEVWHPGYGWVTYDPTPAAGSGTARDAGAWFWPGRILLDGLQHRWNKWVLDYSLTHQEGFFQRAADLMETGDPSDGDGTGGVPSWLWWVGALVAAAGAVWLVRTGRRGGSVPTRLYLRLRTAYDPAGFDDVPRGMPLAFLSAVEERDAPGREAATSLVRRYLRLRFGGGAASPEELDAMRRELTAARRALRGS